MNETSRRGWIKNIAIVFLVILLLLTFFSNTIMNYSLPEVFAQYARYDSISTAIKTSGTVKANESFVVIYDEAEEGMEAPVPGQTRKILSVYVKQGDTVALGDPIMALKGGPSKELEEAEKELRELEIKYEEGKLQDAIDGLTSNKDMTAAKNALAKLYEELADLKTLYEEVKNGSDPSILVKVQQKEVDRIKTVITEIEEKIKDAQGKITAVKPNITEDYISGKTIEEKYNEAKQKYETLESEFNTLTAEVERLKAEYDALSTTYSDSEEIRALSDAIEASEESIDKTILALEREIEDYYLAYIDELANDIYDSEWNDKEDIPTTQDVDQTTSNTDSDTGTGTNKPTTPSVSVNKKYDLEEIKEALLIFKNHYTAGILPEQYHIYHYLDIFIYKHRVTADMYVEYKGEVLYLTGTELRSVEDKLASIDIANRDIELAKQKLAVLGTEHVEEIDSYIIDKAIAKLKTDYDTADAKLKTITADYEAAKKTYEGLILEQKSSVIISDNEAIIAVFEQDKEIQENLLEEAEKKLADLKEDVPTDTTGNIISWDLEDIQDDIDAKTLEIQGKELEIKIDEAENAKSDTTATFTRDDQAKQIAELKEKIETLKNAPDQTDIKAPIAGKIVEVNYVPGNSVTSGATVARIEVADKGYICEISMATEIARKIQVGAECSIVNSWHYNEVEATVAQIRSDPQSQGKNRIVVINLKGDVSEGDTLNFSIGDKSQSYESVLPNSAIREDSEGKFVLVVESKNTPLSVRYTARRMNVEIIASDDTKSAVSGLYGSEFVITSAESPISDGQQVRLAEN